MRPSIIDAARHYAERMAVFATETVQPGGIVFLGSSHLEWFDTGRFLPGYRIVNRAIASDRLGIGGRGILHRLDLSVFDCRPSFVVLQNGINDLGELARTGEPPLPDVLAAYERAVAAIRGRLPEVPLCLVNEMPTTGRFAHCNPFVPTLNEHIQSMAETYDCLHLDIYHTVVDATGELRSDLTWDGLHLNEEGCRLLGERLKAVLPAAS